MSYNFIWELRGNNFFFRGNNLGISRGISGGNYFFVFKIIIVNAVNKIDAPIKTLNFT